MLNLQVPEGTLKTETDTAVLVLRSYFKVPIYMDRPAGIDLAGRTVVGDKGG